MNDHPLVAGRLEVGGDGGLVLFDEDYRAHIERLDARLARERAEVLALRAEIANLKSGIGRK